MTEKLYYKDAYIKEFDATVLSSVMMEDGTFDVVLDKSAFFPEEGGQSSDKGYISDSRVTDVQERDGIVHHFCQFSLEEGVRVRCSIDFDERFEKMQCHTAEHILCGIMHKLYGAENVGFHLGDEDVIFDVDKVLTREQLDEVRRLANKAVYENRTVNTFFPSSEEIQTLQYRSKLDLKENVRIVNIDGYDSCACCAPHVSFTGEIGTIAILDFEKHRGGTRIHMLAGARAERDYAKRYNIIKKISALTSEPQETVACSVENLVKMLENAKQSLKSARLKEVQLKAQMLPFCDGNTVVLLEDFSISDLIDFSNVALHKVGGLLVTLSGSDGDFKYVISSRTYDVRAKAKEINAALSGRGGGRPEMIQGSFAASLAEIESYFK